MYPLLRMEPSKRHLRISHLLEVQRKEASRVDLEDSYSTEFVAGVDQASVDDRIISGAVVLGPSLEVIGHDPAPCRLAHQPALLQALNRYPIDKKELRVRKWGYEIG